MIPYDLKKDRNGILYADKACILSNQSLLLDNREDESDNSRSLFYRIKTTDDYIIKRTTEDLDRKDRKAYMNMLISLLQLQNRITRTEFPIGYYCEWKKIKGLIIRYYPKGISLDRVIKERNLSLLKRYYSHSENDVHNLFMLLDEYLECLYELLKNGIYYLDINLNNIVLDDNQVRIIDFEPTRGVGVSVIYGSIRKTIFSRYVDLISDVLYAYSLINQDIDAQLVFSYFTVDEYSEAKSLIKKLEDRIR